jgi:hypothetical protein
MSAPGSRVRPYPWDARLGVPTDTPAGRIGLMLVPNDSGLLVGKKQQTLEGVVPTLQEYDSAPIYRERTFAFKPTAGMGERVQSSHADRRYYWGSNVWVTGGLAGKGPLVHSLTPALTAARVTQFVDGINAARTPTQYILRGDSVLRRNDDTSAGQVVLHTRAGHVATSAVRWMAAGAGATDALYVAWEDGVLERFVADATWASCVLPAGFAPSFLEIVGDELWGADPRTSQIRKTTADPMIAGSWGGSIQVGDQSTPITCIRQAQNHLVIFKADGDVFTINADGSDNDLYPGLKVHQDTENGRTAVSWLDSVWFTAGPTFYRLSLADAPQLSPAGPGRMLDNASPVHGPVQAFCGWGGYQAFAGVYNTALNTSYLLTYGNWQPSPERDSTGFTFVDQYDGSIADFPGKKISAMGLSSQLGQDRLYVGFSDGTFCWIKLIRNPLAVDSGAEYTDQISEIVLPLHTAMFQADTKAFLGYSVFGPVMRQGDEVNLAYRLMASSGAVPSDPTGNWVVLPTSFEHNGQRVDSPINLAATAISLKATFVNSIPTATPVIDTIALHERVVPAFKRDYTGTIDARPNAARRDGATSRIPTARTRSAMIEAAATPNAVTLELPDETLQSLAMFGYQERQVPHSAAAGQGWLIDFQATQFATIGQYGIIRRLRGTKIKDLRGYPIRLLKTL